MIIDRTFLQFWRVSKPGYPRMVRSITDIMKAVRS